MILRLLVFAPVRWIARMVPGIAWSYFINQIEQRRGSEKRFYQVEPSKRRQTQEELELETVGSTVSTVFEEPVPTPELSPVRDQSGFER